MSSDARPATMPRDFGPYRFRRLVGSGGSSTVYQVEDTQRGVLAAMKVGRADLDPAARERFTTETHVRQQLRHPNIAWSYDSGSLPDGRLFLLTEWVDGADLDALLRGRTPLDIRDVLLLSRSVARALGYAHEQGILHLDIKPANILVPQGDGRYRFDETKLLDFSVVAMLQKDTGQTRAGSVVGTPYYMSPEQVRGEALTPAADVFSLGVVMYEMLAGRRPFEGSTAAATLYAALYEGAPPLPLPIPVGVADLVEQCLAKDPKARPASGNRLAASIEIALDELKEPALPAILPAAAPAEAPDTLHGPPPPASAARTAPDTLAGAPPPASAPRKMPIAVIAAAAVLAVAALVALFLAGRSVPAHWRLIGLGALLIVAGVVAGLALRRYLLAQRSRVSSDISALLGGARTKQALSAELARQMDELMKKCQLMDEQFLGLSMVLMVKEYGAARKFDDRQKALMNAITILDRLGPKLSPWYVRHEKLIASGVSLVGIVSGLATAAESVAKVVKGAP